MRTIPCTAMQLSLGYNINSSWKKCLAFYLLSKKGGIGVLIHTFLFFNKSINHSLHKMITNGGEGGRNPGL